MGPGPLSPRIIRSLSTMIGCVWDECYFADSASKKNKHATNTDFAIRNLRSFTKAFFFAPCSTYAKFTSQLRRPSTSAHRLAPHWNWPFGIKQQKIFTSIYTR